MKFYSGLRENFFRKLCERRKNEPEIVNDYIDIPSIDNPSQKYRCLNRKKNIQKYGSLRRP